MGIWLILASVVVILDQLTKYVVVSGMSYGETWHIASFFDLVHVRNTGAAFSFLAGHSGWQRWFFIALAVGVSIWLLRMLAHHAAEALMACALALVLGGAVGNVIDRVARGSVVDFLSFHLGEHYWPAFNVADSAICVGVALMLLDQFRKRPGEDDAPEPHNQG
ncbi:MAG: lipoprotein signal peptidase [Rhodocyclaceae bacterium]|nr:lipoprotein signal peptidase [Rhodocyclaceae bacterium]